jgi:hypothetical protein
VQYTLKQIRTAQRSMTRAAIHDNNRRLLTGGSVPVLALLV